MYVRSFCLLMSLLVVGCSPSPGQLVVMPSDGEGNVAPVALGQVVAEFTVRGSSLRHTLPGALEVLPAEGETCVTGWSVGAMLAPEGSILSNDTLIVPAYPETGLEWDMPTMTERNDEFPLPAFAPAFLVGDVSFGWYGGRFIIDEWNDDRIEVRLLDGETCDVDAYFRSGIVETCVADEGLLVFDRLNSTNALEPRDTWVHRGTSQWLVDPRDQTAVCDRVTHVEVNLPTSE